MTRPEGTRRTEPWLSLDDDEQQVRHLIARLTLATWRSVLVGHAAPAAQERFERMNNPVPGDLVVESFFGLHGRDVCRGIGYLVAVQREPEPVWYVQYGPDPADVCRWENASFIATDVP